MKKFIMFLIVILMTVMCVSCGSKNNQPVIDENDSIIEEMIGDTVEILEDTTTVIY